MVVAAAAVLLLGVAAWRFLSAPAPEPTAVTESQKTTAAALAAPSTAPVEPSAAEKQAEPESAATAETASTESTDATRKTRVGSRSARRSAPVVPSRPSTRGRDRARGEDDVDVGF